MIPAMIVAASTVAIVAIAAAVIVALLALIYIVPRGQAPIWTAVAPFAKPS